MSRRAEHYQQVIAGLLPLQKLMLDLDTVLTGNVPTEVVSQYHHYPDTLEKWMEEPGGHPIWYLSDGGYSRVVWNDERGDVFLTSNSTSKVKANWDNAGPQREALERFLRGEYNRLSVAAGLKTRFESKAAEIVNSLLEGDDEAENVERYLSDLPEPEVGLRSPVKPGEGGKESGRIVLHKANDYVVIDRKISGVWVTHWQSMRMGGYVDGHYFRGNYPGAVADYRKRCIALGVDPDASESFTESISEAKSPKMKALKDNRVELDDAERKEVMRRGAVWHHGKDGKPTPAVWKSEVRGKTYYVCNTHRAAAVKPTLKGAIRAFDFIETTS